MPWGYCFEVGQRAIICFADAYHKSSLNLSCSVVLIGIKRPLQLDELTYAWASKLRDRGSLSNMGSKECGFGSLYQT